MESVDTKVLIISLQKMYEAFDTLLDACISGNISKKDIMKARAYLPHGYRNSYGNTKKTTP